MSEPPPADTSAGDVRLSAGADLAASFVGLGGGFLAVPGGRLVPVAAGGELPAAPPPPPSSARPTFDGEVDLAAAIRRLRVWATDEPAQRFRVAVDGVASFSVAAGGGAVRQLSAAPGAPPEAALQAALGPPLVLALALRSLFVLHASACRLPDGAAVLFLGDSGAGKSTLASFLDGETSPDWRRLTDDLTPVDVNAGPPQVRPCFPQLGLVAAPSHAASAVPGNPLNRLPDRLPLAATCLLAVGPAVRLDVLPPRRAAEVLLAHTVAARLFDAPLLTAHLDLAAAIAADGVYRLLYPRQHRALPAVRAALTAMRRVPA